MECMASGLSGPVVREAPVGHLQTELDDAYAQWKVAADQKASLECRHRVREARDSLNAAKLGNLSDSQLEAGLNGWIDANDLVLPSEAETVLEAGPGDLDLCLEVVLYLTYYLTITCIVTLAAFSDSSVLFILTPLPLSFDASFALPQAMTRV